MSLDTDTLQKAYQEYNNSEITEEELLLLADDLIDWRIPVPTIEEFIDEPYFLGNVVNVFPCWREALKTVYPNKIITRTFLAVKGAAGTGKSVFSRIVFLYDMYKIFCVRNLSKVLGISEKTLDFFIVSYNKEKSKEFMGELLSMMRKSPAFQDMEKYYGGRKKMKEHIRIRETSLPTDIVGSDAVSIHLCEINESGKVSKNSTKSKADELIAESFTRIQSRFEASPISFFNHMILDSSDLEANSVIERYITDSVFSDMINVFSFRQWEAQVFKSWFKPNKDGITRFRVYAGDSEVDAHILDDSEDISSYDPDRILWVPIELYRMYVYDIETALRTTAGIGTYSVGKFLALPKIISNFCLPQNVPDTLELVFEDKRQLYEILDIDGFIKLIPEKAGLYASIDLSKNEDCSGVAFGYINGNNEEEIGGIKIRDPIFRIPLVFSIKAIKDGGKNQIDITKIRNLLHYVHYRKPLMHVSYDQYQSLYIEQELSHMNVRNQKIAVDINDKCYLLLKNMLYNNRVFLPDSKKLKYEFSNLIKVGKSRVDHPNYSTKDMSDVVCRLIYTMYAIGEGNLGQVVQPHKQVIDNLAKFYEDMAKEADIRFSQNRRW